MIIDKLKILILTDLHGQRTILTRLDKHFANNKFDAVFMCGDLCNAHDPNNLKYANDFIDLVTIKNKTPLFVVHGNQETDTVKLLYQQKNVTVHFHSKPLSTHKVGYEVIGVGYGDIFPSDPEFAKDKILLSHEPPSSATIKKMQTKTNLNNAPLLHFCGHLHSIAKITKIGKTQLVQIPTAQNFRGVVCELPKSTIRFITFP